MDCTFTHLPYAATGNFPKIIIDYLEQSPQLQAFYQHSPDIGGIEMAMQTRRQFKTNRAVLVEALQKQYAGVEASTLVKENIDKLSKENVLTICTAHQPAIFTGTLYFIYKILHAIKLANELTKKFPANEFVPVYWMGSEDADLDELGAIHLNGEKIVWDTRQTGAVGRMNTKGFDKIINRIAGELSVQPLGKELVQLLRNCYLNSPDIQTGTFKLLNTLFAEYGLIVIVPDTAVLKRLMLRVFEDDLFNQTPSQVVEKTVETISQQYKVQANPREINLFYLKDNIRERIEKTGDQFTIQHSPFTFDEKAMRMELHAHPERFSPNVILRGLFQETVLPNIAFVGGGGEMAYWLELKDLFNHYKTPFPVLLLRNSFLFVEKKWQEKTDKLGFTAKDFFKSEQQLLTELVSRHKNGELKLQTELEAAVKLYHQLKDKAATIDKSLLQHVEALQARAIKPLQELEKKLVRAEKRKYETEQRQIHQIKEALFPNNNLQERVENFMPYYAKWGKDFIKMLYKYSLTLEQEFGILSEL